MSKGGFLAVEAVGLVIAALSAEAVIRGLLDRDAGRLWGAVDWVPGGLHGRLVLLGIVAIAGLAFGGWAHQPVHRNTDGQGEAVMSKRGSPSSGC